MTKDQNTQNDTFRLKAKGTDVAKALDVEPDALCEELGVDDLESVSGGAEECCGTDASCCGTDGGAAEM